MLTIGLCADKARIDGKAVAPDQSFSHAALHCRLEQSTQQVALTKATVPVLREGRVIRHVTIQPEPAEPPICEIEVHLLAQAPFRSDADTVADDEHPDHQLRINRRPPCLTVKRRQLTTQIAESDEAINRPQYMILRNVAFEGEAVEQSSLFDLPWSHHPLNPRRRTRSESVLMNSLKQSFSTESAGSGMTASEPCTPKSGRSRTDTVIFWQSIAQRMPQ